MSHPQKLIAYQPKKRLGYRYFHHFDYLAKALIGLGFLLFNYFSLFVLSNNVDIAVHKSGLKPQYISSIIVQIVLSSLALLALYKGYVRLYDNHAHFHKYWIWMVSYFLVAALIYAGVAYWPRFFAIQTFSAFFKLRYLFLVIAFWCLLEIIYSGVWIKTNRYVHYQLVNTYWLKIITYVLVVVYGFMGFFLLGDNLMITKQHWTPLIHYLTTNWARGGLVLSLMGSLLLTPWVLLLIFWCYFKPLKMPNLHLLRNFKMVMLGFLANIIYFLTHNFNLLTQGWVNTNFTYLGIMLGLLVCFSGFFYGHRKLLTSGGFTFLLLTFYWLMVVLVFLMLQVSIDATWKANNLNLYLGFFLIGVTLFVTFGLKAHLTSWQEIFLNVAITLVSGLLMVISILFDLFNNTLPMKIFNLLNFIYYGLCIVIFGIFNLFLLSFIISLKRFSKKQKKTATFLPTAWQVLIKAKAF